MEPSRPNPGQIETFQKSFSNWILSDGYKYVNNNNLIDQIADTAKYCFEKQKDTITYFNPALPLHMKEKIKKNFHAASIVAKSKDLEEIASHWESVTYTFSPENDYLLRAVIAAGFPEWKVVRFCQLVGLDENSLYLKLGFPCYKLIEKFYEKTPEELFEDDLKRPTRPNQEAPLSKPQPRAGRLKVENLIVPLGEPKVEEFEEIKTPPPRPKAPPQSLSSNQRTYNKNISNVKERLLQKEDPKGAVAAFHAFLTSDSTAISDLGALLIDKKIDWSLLAEEARSMNFKFQGKEKCGFSLQQLLEYAAMDFTDLKNLQKINADFLKLTENVISLTGNLERLENVSLPSKAKEILDYLCKEKIGLSFFDIGKFSPSKENKS